MKSFLSSCFFLFSIFFLTSCGTAEDNKKSRALGVGSRDQIIARGGSIVRDPDRALRDSEHRIQAGGGLFGKKSNSLNDLLNRKSDTAIVGSIGLPINPILWQSSIEVIDFMPIASTDAFSGIIITDWYSTPNNPNEKCKINIFVKGVELKSSNLQVNSFCQKNVNNLWLDIKTLKDNDRKIENAILNKAKKIKLALN